MVDRNVPKGLLDYSKLEYLKQTYYQIMSKVINIVCLQDNSGKVTIDPTLIFTDSKLCHYLYDVVSKPTKYTIVKINCKKVTQIATYDIESEQWLKYYSSY